MYATLILINVEQKVGCKLMNQDRNWGIDALRIISMFMIVLLHSKRLVSG